MHARHRRCALPWRNMSYDGSWKNRACSCLPTKPVLDGKTWSLSGALTFPHHSETCSFLPTKIELYYCADAVTSCEHSLLFSEDMGLLKLKTGPMTTRSLWRCSWNLNKLVHWDYNRIEDGNQLKRKCVSSKYYGRWSYCIRRNIQQRCGNLPCTGRFYNLGHADQYGTYSFEKDLAVLYVQIAHVQELLVSDLPKRENFAISCAHRSGHRMALWHFVDKWNPLRPA